MSREKKMIAEFIQQMKDNHSSEIGGIQLPDGTREYILERIEANDMDTIEFMLKLGYLMGLQTGFAASQAGQSPPTSPIGPLQA